MTSYPESVSTRLIDYTVTDELWRSVPETLRLGVVCLDCLVDQLGAEPVLPELVRIQVATANVTVDLLPVNTYCKTDHD